MGPSTFMRGSMHACMGPCTGGAVMQYAGTGVLQAAKPLLRSYVDGLARRIAAAAGVMSMGKLMHALPCGLPMGPVYE